MDSLKVEVLTGIGLGVSVATEVCHAYNDVLQKSRGQPKGDIWMCVAAEVLKPTVPFEAHIAIRKHFFGSQSAPPLWYPSDADVSKLNVARFMQKLAQNKSDRFGSVEECKTEFKKLLHLACEDPEFYWRHVIDFMDLRFVKDPERIVCHSIEEDGIRWFQGSKFNIAEMALDKICNADRSIIWADEHCPGEICYMSGADLKSLSLKIAAAIAAKYSPGTSIAVYLPMTAISVAIYLGIVLAGCVVVSIADSFATPEVKTRLRIANTKLIFTQDVVKRGGKTHELYTKVAGATTAKSVVLPENFKAAQCPLSTLDVVFDSFLEEAPVSEFKTVVCDAYAPSNILFSSGTTGTPKAIPWTHLSPLKCAVDGLLCQNICSDSVICWPTNLGWMMGPWLIYAAFTNRAPIALFQGSPTSPAFCKFVETAGVTMLGVIPSIVRAWKEKGMTQGCDWSRINCFSSTGEASSYEEYHWLMAQAGYKPVIEYCGGTEMGGAYISGCMIHSQTPSGFSTPVVGSHVVHVKEDLIEDITTADDFEGELAVVPPMLGLSQSLLNKNHVEVYYQGMPRHGSNSYRLRRHGDTFAKQDGVYFSRGRCDDTMNLGGIKVSCVELEYVVMKSIRDIREAAAVGFTQMNGGPEELALFLVMSSSGTPDVEALKQSCQRVIKEEINPLFKVSHVHICDFLPRTSSNKLTRNVLRDELRRARL